MAVSPQPGTPQPQGQVNPPTVGGPSSWSIQRRALILAGAAIIVTLRLFLLAPRITGFALGLGTFLELCLVVYGYGFFVWILGNIPEHRRALEQAVLQRWQQQQSQQSGGYQQQTQPATLPTLTGWDYWLDILGAALAAVTGTLFLVDFLNRIIGIISDPLFSPLVTVGAILTMIATGIIVLVL